MNSYFEQVKGLDDQIDPEFWVQPQGIEVEYDSVQFLYIPDFVMTYIAAHLARKVYRYQVDNAQTSQQITKAVMVTMGGMLPGVLLHDHLAWNLNTAIPSLTFGTLGVKYYDESGHALDRPQIVHPLSIDVSRQVVGVIEDHIDTEGKLRFVARHLVQEHHARRVVIIAPYLKSNISTQGTEVIWYGVVSTNTLIITSREIIETLVKRVPFWRDNGATLAACKENLRRIGYPEYILDIYLRATYERG